MLEMTDCAVLDLLLTVYNVVNDGFRVRLSGASTVKHQRTTVPLPLCFFCFSQFNKLVAYGQHLKK